VFDEIKLSNGQIALIDKGDFMRLNKFKWHFVGGYAARKESGKTIYMHREIKNALKGTEVDHINNNGLDNRASNLRIVTRTQNNQNRGMQKSNTSGYKGVVWHKQNQKWWARIQINGKQISLGCFDAIEKAANAYKIASEQYHGSYSRIN
jgi:hypothetical protein